MPISFCAAENAFEWLMKILVNRNIKVASALCFASYMSGREFVNEFECRHKFRFSGRQFRSRSTSRRNFM
jgi:hypothetical protein